jgi:FkbM family methyltransferase
LKIKNIMEFKEISGKKVFYFESEDPVISSLKNGILFGASNFRLLSEFILDESGYVLDCGAHIGTFALESSKKYKTICVEAADKNIQCLNKTFESSDKVEVRSSILSSGVFKCDFSSDYGPFGSLVQNGENGKFQTNTLDNIVGEKVVSAIKLDIEGGEIEALKGCENILSKQKPPMIVEVNGHCLRLIGKRPEDLFDIIDSFGYNIYLNNNGSMIQINKEKVFPFCVNDVICLHRDNMDKYKNKIKFTRFLSDNEIFKILSEGYSNSNSDCQLYFSSLILK